MGIETNVSGCEMCMFAQSCKSWREHVVTTSAQPGGDLLSSTSLLTTQDEREQKSSLQPPTVSSARRRGAGGSQFDNYGRSAVSISSLPNGELGEHRRHDTDGIRLEIDAPGCRSRVRRSIEPTCWHAGLE